MSDIKDIGLKIEAITEALRVINIVNHTDLHLDQKHIEMLNVIREPIISRNSLSGRNTRHMPSPDAHIGQDIYGIFPPTQL